MVLSVPGIAVAVVVFLTLLSVGHGQRTAIKIVNDVDGQPRGTVAPRGAAGTVVAAVSRAPKGVPPPPIDGEDEHTPHNHWQQLARLCFTQESGKYTYTVCPFHNVTQIEKNARNAQPFVLGVWDEWHVSDDGNLQMFYSDGTWCASKSKARSTSVDLSCAEEVSTKSTFGESLKEDTHISDFAEPNTCEYALNIRLPIGFYICNSMAEEANRWQPKPNTLGKCNKQHAFLVQEVSFMQRCIDDLASAHTHGWEGEGEGEEESADAVALDGAPTTEGNKKRTKRRGIPDLCLPFLDRTRPGLVQVHASLDAAKQRKEGGDGKTPTGAEAGASAVAAAPQEAHQDLVSDKVKDVPDMSALGSRAPPAAKTADGGEVRLTNDGAAVMDGTGAPLPPSPTTTTTTTTATTADMRGQG